MPAVFISFIRKTLSFLLLCFFVPTLLCAQDEQRIKAQGYALEKKYREAAKLYQALYNPSSSDVAIYREYLDVLLAGKAYKEAEKLVGQQLSAKQGSPLLLTDLGRVYREAGKPKKAQEQFENAVASVSGDDMLTTTLVAAFLTIQEDAYAIRVYERAIEILRNPFIYNMPLARLYAKNKAIDKAVDVLLAAGPAQRPGIEDTKALLLEILGNDPAMLQLAQKALIRRINEQPNNIWFTDLLTWLYTQKGDWEGALIQIQALDARNRKQGKKLLAFSRTATQAAQYNIALDALDAILEEDFNQPAYITAKAEKLRVRMMRLSANPLFTAAEVTVLEKEFEAFFTEAPLQAGTATVCDYAMLLARYADKPEAAVTLLEQAVAQPGGTKEFIGQAKLQLGDYYLLTGRIWDASLVYSQVDKAFREDMAGEEARFRNARLAYYRGDFEWAQGQLSVLKASTSELIANDALHLSILITENIPPDSNLTPLQRFADADLLLFRHKYAEAAAVLDSLSQQFPRHPLADDILMLRADIARKQRDYTKALGYLQEITDKHGNDVLADDALFKTAELIEQYLKQPEEAKKYYEQLIISHPGSTYIQAARNRLTALKGQVVLP